MPDEQTVQNTQDTRQHDRQRTDQGNGPAGSVQVRTGGGDAEVDTSAPESHDEAQSD